MTPARAIPRLWYVTDGTRGAAGRDPAQVIAAAAEGGVGAVLLRERDRSDRSLGELLERLDKARADGLRIVASRRPDIARAFDLDGVQLTADSLPVAEVRAWLGPARWIGYSAHSLEEATRAIDAGADYVTLSPVFATSSKPGARPLGLPALAQATAALAAPILALGGVTHARTHGILDAGAWGVAVVTAIGAAPDVPGAARAFARILDRRASCIAASPA